MSVGPLDILPIVTRVRATVAAFKQVQGAAEMAAAIETAVVATPSAFVLLAREDATSKGGGSEALDHQVRTRFSVVLAVRNYQLAQLGTAQADELRTLIAATRLGLMGWMHPGFAVGQSRQVTLVSGALLRYDAATIWWQEVFELTFWSRV